MSPETLETLETQETQETEQTQQTLDEAFENIVVLEPSPPDPEVDWMPGEFDIT